MQLIDELEMKLRQYPSFNEPIRSFGTSDIREKQMTDDVKPVDDVETPSNIPDEGAENDVEEDDSDDSDDSDDDEEVV